jgi:hypothetical protein
MNRPLEELSRDVLRSKVQQLKVLKYAEMKKLNKRELINCLRENENNLGRVDQPHLSIVEKVSDEVSNVQENLANSQPFRNIVIDNIYENKNNSINLDEYLDKINRRNFDYFIKIVDKQLFKFLEEKETNVINDIMNENVKIMFTIEIEMSRLGDNNDKFYVSTKIAELKIGDDRVAFYRNACREMLNNMEALELRGSGWHFQKINSLLMKQSRYQQFRGASYMALPEWIRRKEAIINIKNDDNKCFMWCILAALHPVTKNSERVSKYKKYENELKFDGITFPIKKSDIPKIEKMNNLGVNVFANEGNEIYTLIATKMKEIPQERIINLFYIKGDEDQSHYCLVKNLSRLLSRAISDHKSKTHICPRCHIYFSVQHKLDQHIEECGKHNPVVFNKPKIDYNEFINIKHGQKIPYVIYADFESIIEKYTTASDNPNKSWTEKQGKHIAASFCAIVVNSKRILIDIKVYRGLDAAKKFNEYIIGKCDKLINTGDKNMEILARDDKRMKEFNASTFCPQCGKEYSITNRKVRDHDHWTGEYRGPLCNMCNLTNKKNRFIPVFFHNSKGYDSHLILGAISPDTIKYSDIKVIPSNSEKYISFSYVKKRNEQSKLTYEIRFLDSFSFMNSSLDTLSKNLTDDQCFITKEYYDKIGSHLFKIMRKKGIYPYEYMDSIEKYGETELPHIEMFKDKLNGKDCKEEDYEYAKAVFVKTGCKNLGDYTEKYMINDVLLLADVFETFRETCLKEYTLDPCWYYTSPGLAWDAMLKITGIRLQTIKDYDMYLFIEKGIRGGMVNAVKRYSKANNKYMEKYDPNLSSNYLLYLDANNLYGWAMCQKLPYDELKFEMNQQDLKQYKKELADLIKKYNEMINLGCRKLSSGLFSSYLELEKELFMYLHKSDCMLEEDSNDNIRLIENYKTNEYQDFGYNELKNYIETLNRIGKGCIFEVDLDYPKELHNEHNDFPLCPQNTKVNKQKFSKLMNTLYDKEKYVIHYRNLLQVLEHGLKLKKIHRILTFKESNWMEKYINLNTKLRKEAKNDFEKDFFKLMNCSVFGKSMENIRNRVDIRLVTDKKKALRLIKQPNFKDRALINDDLLSIEMVKTKLEFNKPIYVGFSILDLSKYLMYEFNYDVMKKKYEKKIRLIYQDTDSLIYEIITDDIYEDLNDLKEHFDFSDYPKNHPLYCEKNKKVVGKFKDELNGNIMIECVALKPKQYAYKTENVGETKICKGIKKNVIKTLKVDEYKDCLFDNTVVRKEQYLIQAKKHQIYTVKQNKVALNAEDKDEFKRYICDNKIDTLAYGHYQIDS